jgi:hypothetical protein
MIDADMLRQLGWKEELIQEVTRVASEVRRSAVDVSAACSATQDTLIASPVGSGSTLFVENPTVRTKEK